MSKFSRIILLFVFVGAAAPAAAQSALLGVTYGNMGWDIKGLQALETWESKKNAVVVMFTNWDGSRKVQDNLFKLQLPAIWDNDNVPLITWEPSNGRSTPSDIVSRIARGDYDGYIAGWAERLRGFLAGPDDVVGTADDRRAYLRLAHEMNGDWYPWGQAAPGEYIAMWIRIHQFFDALDLGPSQLQWVWCVTNYDFGTYTAEEFYPGDTYVDWIGVDGYNWGSSASWSYWQTPAEALGPMTARLRAVSSRPLALTESGSTALTTSGTSVAAKNQWITQFYDWALQSGFRLVAWFNMDTDADFSIFGGRVGDVTFKFGRTSYKAFSAYKTAVQAPSLIGADSGNPRLISDARFKGQ